MAKYAVVIGVSDYPQATGDGGLKPLLRATKDAEAVAEVLRDVDMGGFDEVELLTNPDKTVIETTIEQFFSTRRAKQDVVLLYFSGHGGKDFRSGHLFLTAYNTQKSDIELVKSTAISSVAIHSFLKYCPSKRQVIILDCCYSGAFAEGLNAKDGGQEIDLESELGGEGRAILTSSSAVELSYEREEGELSVYTDYLLEGIKTGSADSDKDGWISVDEAHSYAQQRVKAEANGMNPKIYSSEDGYKIHLTKAPMTIALSRYREQVLKYVKTGKGRISPIGRKILDRNCKTFGINEAEAQQIEKEVLVPYQYHQENLEEYQEALIYALAQAQPISEASRIELDDFQKMLGLSDEDIQIIEKQLDTQVKSQSAPQVQKEYTDLEIIQQLEQEIGRKLEKFTNFEKISEIGYVLNENKDVVQLNLSQCNLNSIPNALFNLKKLEFLVISGNKVEQLPDSFVQLLNLSVLGLSKNELKELPASFGQLQNLSYLYLSSNQLKELPTSFGQLQNLSELRLDNNQLKELPASFEQLHKLQKAYLDSNKISQLPKEILKLNLEIKWKTNSIKKGIAIGDNPLTSPPPEIIKQGQQAIREYFEKVEQN